VTIVRNPVAIKDVKAGPLGATAAVPRPALGVTALPVTVPYGFLIVGRM